MFYSHKDFTLGDFYTTFSVCYSLLYNDVVPSDYGRIRAFDYMIGKYGDEGMKNFYKDFCALRGDVCTSDREAEAFIMACKRYENDWRYNE